MTEIEIVFFGVLKQHFPRELRLKTEHPLTPETLKSKLAATLEPASNAAAVALLEECAVATETEVVPRGQVIPAGKKIALLPPVCGG